MLLLIPFGTSWADFPAAGAHSPGDGVGLVQSSLYIQATGKTALQAYRQLIR